MDTATTDTGARVRRQRDELEDVELVCEWAWGWRLELLLLALLAAGFGALRLKAGLSAVVSAAVLVLVVVALLACGPARRWLWRALCAAHVRRAWWRAWLHCGLSRVRARKVQRIPAGELVSVRVSRGFSFEDITARSEELAACMGLRELRVERDRGNASKGTVTLVRRDPLADMGGRPWPALGAEGMSLWDLIALGMDEMGRSVRALLVERSLLAGGEPGAGKSAAMAILVAAAAFDRTVKLWLLDGKRVELAAWEPCAERLVGPDVGEAIEVLEAVQAEMEDRYRQLLARGLRKVTPGLPLHVVVCDELAFYLTVEDKAQRARFSELLRDLVARGRAAGVIVLAATQKPSADVVPSSLRDLFGFRLALRCTTPQASDTILGQGWASQGYSAATIAPGERGVGYLLADDGIPVRLRTFYLSDEDITTLAARAAALRRHQRVELPS